MSTYLLLALGLYFGLLLTLATFMSGRLDNEEDFLVGGRSFNLWLTTSCLFATWFGAGTLIAATDQVAVEGAKVTALEPLGAGLCLILAGLFLAKPLWELKLMTYADFFRKHFGVRVELLSVFINVPIYVGWIAVQIVSLANILSVFFPLPVWLLMLGITVLTTYLTLVGGMWSVSITDSFQLLIIIIGLIYLLLKISHAFPEGLMGLLSQVEQEKLIFVPTEKMSDLLQWLGVLSIAALGNLTGQDLGQRIFSASSADTAQRGALLAGVGYLIFGSIPVVLGLTAPQTLGIYQGSVIPNLIKNFLDPFTAVVLSLTIISAVVSTITSALLAPASMFSHNFLKKHFPKISALKLCKLGVLGISALSLTTALAGEDVYGLLESSYAIGFVAFFVPVTVGLYSKKLDERACLISMAVSILIWLPELFSQQELPFALLGVLAGYPTYFIAYKLMRL